MREEFQINFQLEDVEKWLSNLQNHIPSKFENNILSLDKNFGNGTIQLLHLQEGLKVCFIDIEVKHNVVLNQIPTKSNNCFMLDFHKRHHNFNVIIDEQTYSLGMENYSVLLLSSMTRMTYQIMKHQPVSYVHLYISKDWLINNILESNSKLYSNTTGNIPIKVIEHLDYSFGKMIQLEPKSKKLTLLSTVFNMFHHFMHKVDNRENIKFSAINHNDLDSLRNSAYRIEDSIPDVISNKELAKQCHMSISKFMRLFKEIFGTTPYQYHLKIKMDKAMHLIKAQNLSIPQVCESLNYRSQGNFRKSFKNHFGINPYEL